MCALLVAAASANDDILIKRLLALPCTTPNEGTPLFIAAERGYEKCVLALLGDPRVDVNLSCSNGVTPLLIAATVGHVKSVKALLSHPGIDPNKPSLIYRSTPLYNAVRGGHTACVQALLTHPSTDPNVTTTVFGVTPLYTAAQQGLRYCVQLLLQHPRIDPNKTLSFAMDGGSTPLHAAMWRRHHQCVQMLLNHCKTVPGSLETMATMLLQTTPEIRDLVTKAITWPGSLRHMWITTCLHNGLFMVKSYKDSNVLEEGEKRT